MKLNSKGIDNCTIVLYSRMKENVRLRFRLVTSDRLIFGQKFRSPAYGFTSVEYRVPCISRTFYLRGSLCKDLHPLPQLSLHSENVSVELLARYQNRTPVFCI